MPFLRDQNGVSLESGASVGYVVFDDQKVSIVCTTVCKDVYECVKYVYFKHKLQKLLQMI